MEAKTSNALEFILDHDTEKELKRGKRVYKDDEGHRIYLDGSEVKKLESPSKIVLRVEGAAWPA